MERDYYTILEIPRDASERDIKRAYHRLARERHPDKGTSPEEVKRLQEEFALISTAYNVLKDKDKRVEYDVRLSKERAKGAAGEEPAGKGAAPSGAGAKGAAVARERAQIAQRAFTKGQQLAGAGDHVRAVEFYEAAIKNDDTQALYHAKLGMALMHSHKAFSRAVIAIQRAIELDPYNVEHRLILGEAYEIVGSTSLAIKTYREILKWEPANVKAIERLAALGAAPGQSILDRLLRKLRRR